MGTFVAVGHRGMRLVSRDGGKSWSEPVFDKPGTVLRGVCAHGGRCVTFGQHGGETAFAVTEDGGGNWKMGSKDAGYSRYVLGMIWANGRFHGWGGDRTSVGAANVGHTTSEDGLAWTDWEKTQPDSNNLYRIATDGKLLVAVGMRGRRSASNDGIHWKDAPEAKAAQTLIDIAYGAGVFVGVGLHGLRMTTKDGVQWSAPLRGEEGEHLNSILWTGDRFVAVGLGGTYLSPDGQKWERRPNTNAPVIVAYGDGGYVGARWKGRLLRSPDGVNWTEVIQCPEHVEGIGYIG